jgi:hypothetical protein
MLGSVCEFGADPLIVTMCDGCEVLMERKRWILRWEHRVIGESPIVFDLFLVLAVDAITMSNVYTRPKAT